jgi:hypothetical protein
MPGPNVGRVPSLDLVQGARARRVGAVPSGWYRALLFGAGRIGTVPSGWYRAVMDGVIPYSIVWVGAAPHIGAAPWCQCCLMIILSVLVGLIPCGDERHHPVFHCVGRCCLMI